MEPWLTPGQDLKLAILDAHLCGAFHQCIPSSVSLHLSLQGILLLQISKPL